MSTQIKAPGILHRYTTHLLAFEHTRDGVSPNNSLLFVGGLNEGLLTIPYAQDLAAALPPSYSFIEVLLSSAFSGWGHSSISQDVDEMGQCVEYFQSLRPGGKVVLMGNSTGCQDVLGYLSFQGSRPRVDGGVLQAPVSDRESIEMFYPAKDLEKYNEMARRWVKEGRGDHVLPNEVSLPLMGARVTANRWLSLASPGPQHAGEDDLFSSDLDGERFQSTFGMAAKRGTALLILFSGNDAWVPKSVDKQNLVDRMHKAFIDAGGQLGHGSGILSGASHTVRETGEVRDELLKRVKDFVGSIEKGTLGKD
ncbi:MAG: hypothetical protein Q9169_002288 [Polycauliona sp. 2 TL-2023]